MDRRAFVAVTAGAALFGRTAHANTVSSDAAEIGWAAMRARAVECDAKSLRNSLGYRSQNQVKIDQTWQPAIRNDFAAGRTVYVDGWVLSKTEARLCALVALTEPGF